MFLLLFPNSLPDLCSSFKVLVRRLRRFLFSLNEPIHCILIIIERRRGRIEDFISNMLYPRLNFIRQFVTFDEPRWRKSKPWRHVLFFAVLLSFLFSSSSNGACLLNALRDMRSGELPLPWRIKTDKVVDGFLEAVRIR